MQYNLCNVFFIAVFFAQKNTQSQKYLWWRVHEYGADMQNVLDWLDFYQNNCNAMCFHSVLLTTIREMDRFDVEKRN